MNWGHKIILAFILFGVFIITLVVVCVRQDFHLVSQDYYQKELDYETEIIQTRNAMALPEQPQLILNDIPRQLDLVFPNGLHQGLLDGHVLFFRPSDAHQDFRKPIILDVTGRQAFDITGMEKGMWRIELSWRDGQRRYFLEKKIRI